MTKFNFFVLSLLLVASLNCFAVINYTISFTGSGASTTVGDVIVQNLTKGTSVTVPAGNVLSLTVATAVEQLNANDEFIHVYLGSVEGKSTVSFFAKQTGVTQINAIGLDGRKIAGTTANLQTGINSFQLSLPKGSFIIQVSGNGYAYTAKMLNQTDSKNKPNIVYTGSEKPASSSPQKSKNSVLGTTTMAYTTGDQLLYKATSGNYSTIVTDVPTADKTTNFNFVASTDADGNNYTTVTIGTQTWMAENLKTTKYNDGTSIPLVTDNAVWRELLTPGYCWYNNDANTYKTKYGALYNWYTANTANLAPTGWHVPTNAEWTTLTNYVSAHLSISLNAAKDLAATTDWYIFSIKGFIGYSTTQNNSTGFSALPGGCRVTSGPFDYIGDYGYWWSATDATEYANNPNYAWYMGLIYYDSNVNHYVKYKTSGFSVRCVRD